MSSGTFASAVIFEGGPRWCLAQLGDLTARDVHAVVTGSGLIRVAATATLNAAVPGSGAIIYTGDPHVTGSVTGSGTITRG